MSERIESLDTLKSLSLFAVVIVHIIGIFLERGIEPTIFDFIIFNTARFGVPVFFLTSGFLFKRKLNQKENRKYVFDYTRKIFYYYIIASIVYLVLQISVLFIENNSILTLPKEFTIETSIIPLIYELFYQGTAVRGSLWFLPALAISIGVIYLFNSKDRIKTLLLVSGALHLLGIIINTYQVVNIPLPSRDALFFGLFYTTAGFNIGKIKIEKLNKHSKKLFFVSGIFVILNIIENSLIHRLEGVSFIMSDYALMTFPLALFIFLFFLSKPKLGKSSRLNTYGKYTLLGYISHQITGALLLGLTIVIQVSIGLELLRSHLWNIMLLALTYVITMESVLKYRQHEEKIRI